MLAAWKRWVKAKTDGLRYPNTPLTPALRKKERESAVHPQDQIQRRCLKEAGPAPRYVFEYRCIVKPAAI
jgi:hypothetical protein